MTMATRTPAQWLGPGLVIAAFAALAWSGYYAAETLQLVSGDRGNPAAGRELEGASVTASSRDRQFEVSRIAQAHLFGTVRENVQQETAPAPETKLRLDLVGLVASADRQLARAIIRVDGGKVRPYAMEDAIEGTDATIHAIEPGRVLLERSGALESLALKRESALEAGAGSGSAPRGSQLDPETSRSAPQTDQDRARVTEFREKAANNELKLPF